jgi:hypothetical protein
MAAARARAWAGFPSCGAPSCGALSQVCVACGTCVYLCVYLCVFLCVYLCGALSQVCVGCGTCVYLCVYLCVLSVWGAVAGVRRVRHGAAPHR